ncbi:MAG: hypothetical protein HZA77_02635 [Candidatus Schekmanbacteria bacterium]|nr:hypothetical protein [Candidatus Schekmanbacteria bacterium]
MENLKGEKIGEYDYNYRYKSTYITHHIDEFFDEKRKIRLVLLKKETRKGDIFVKLPSSIWVTCPGYPPLSTDAALQHVFDRDLTLFFAGLPTVQSETHIKIFDGYLREKLAAKGIDYDKHSKELKEKTLARKINMTGFLYMKKDVIDESLAPSLLDIVCSAYEEVLKSEPCECPVNDWVQRIVGDQSVTEFHLFKKEGFDVPLSGQRAFFTMLLDQRELPDKEDDFSSGIEKMIKEK